MNFKQALLKKKKEYLSFFIGPDEYLFSERDLVGHYKSVF